MKTTRRESLGIMAAALTASASTAFGATQDTRPAGKHEIAPLPFDPKGLKGISEKMIVSHHDNNYAGAVRNLNKVEGDLALVTKDTAGFVVGGLKERELNFRNSATLHELYFANLGGDGKASGAAVDEIARTWGTIGRWEELFRATGAALGGGSGWCILAWDFHRGALHTHWSGGHTQAEAGSVPLLVMDMYEHAYQMDYGAAAAKYIEAYFANVHWAEVNRRFERAQRAQAALRG